MELLGPIVDPPMAVEDAPDRGLQEVETGEKGGLMGAFMR